MISEIKRPAQQYREATVVSTIITNEGLVEIFQYVDSGKVITRKKIDTITDVDHPGIILGKDKAGRIWTAHNHFEIGRPTYHTLQAFAKGQKVFYDQRSVDYTQTQIVERTIAEVQKGKTYNRLNYNCQTFVNLIATNTNKSEAVDKIADGAIGVSVFLLILGLISRNKGLITTGLTIGGIGGAAKGISRVR